MSAGWSGLIANNEIVPEPAYGNQKVQFSFVVDYQYHVKVTNVDRGENFAFCGGFDSPLREQSVRSIGTSDTVGTLASSSYSLCERLDLHQKRELRSFSRFDIPIYRR
jgi:hypothetical protein